MPLKTHLEDWVFLFRTSKLLEYILVSVLWYWHWQILFCCAPETCFQFAKQTKNKFYGPFFWMRLNCLKATEPLQKDSLILTTQSPGVPGVHLIDLVKLKSWDDLGGLQWFWTQNLWIKNRVPGLFLNCFNPYYPSVSLNWQSLFLL